MQGNANGEAAGRGYSADWLDHGDTTRLIDAEHAAHMRGISMLALRVEEMAAQAPKMSLAECKRILRRLQACEQDLREAVESHA